MQFGSEPKIARGEVGNYFSTLASLLEQTETTASDGRTIEFAAAFNQMMEQARATHAAGNKLIIFGNGGSATIASHMATDFSKNGDIRAVTLNDSSMLTCLGNDLGYENVFAKQIELYAQAGDTVIAISSSGKSPNILKAVAAARKAGCSVITLSGFTAGNPLRRLGDLNFYIAADRYGLVEIGHLTICHAVLDFMCGLRFPANFEKCRTDATAVT